MRIQNHDLTSLVEEAECSWATGISALFVDCGGFTQSGEERLKSCQGLIIYSDGGEITNGHVCMITATDSRRHLIADGKWTTGRARITYEGRVASVDTIGRIHTSSRRNSYYQDIYKLHIRIYSGYGFLHPL